ncbi:hypothetical protein [Magnetofaba australis]|uniref:Lipoprotein n=1 Tax=Magnetofaba australis IT-1 TaxID=1434232 RepID=A0A1Y2K1F0_9PROT|nr:hypothetical protein [Magnetofaba australis]OSM01860.1 hypothetical protein MAIT1_01911 [Magnetofaba australis IT-1]
MNTKITALVLGAGMMLAGGCASLSDEDRAMLESAANESKAARMAAEEAKRMAGEAKSAATMAQQDAERALKSAQMAEDSARAAATRATRTFEHSMMK